MTREFKGIIFDSVDYAESDHRVVGWHSLAVIGKWGHECKCIDNEGAKQIGLKLTWEKICMDMEKHDSG